MGSDIVAVVEAVQPSCRRLAVGVPRRANSNTQKAGAGVLPGRNVELDTMRVISKCAWSILEP